MTIKELRTIMPYLTAKRAETYQPLLSNYMPQFGIDTPLRQAHFLAQIAHESGELRYTEEIASGERYDTGKLAERLGNTPEADGDGQLYKGRGLIQLTGRRNYEAFKKATGYDVINNPQMLAKPDMAVISACWFWQTNKLNRYADADDVRQLTKRINGGYNGLESRTKYLLRAKKVFGL